MADKTSKHMEDPQRRLDQLQRELDQQKAYLSRERVHEKLRAEVSSMRKREDLLNVILLMFNEVRALGIRTPVCSIFFVNEEKDLISCYSALENLRKFGISWTNPDFLEIDADTAAMHYIEPLDESWDADLKRWRAGAVWVERRSTEQDMEELEGVNQLIGVDAPFPFIGPEWPTTGLPFKQGWVTVRHKGVDQRDLAFIEKLTEALSLGYMRYLDFERLEEQNLNLQQTLQQLQDAQQQLVLQEKMASLGHLAAGVVHEVNSPLGAINSSGDSLMRAVHKLEKALAANQPGTLAEENAVQAALKVIGTTSQVLGSASGRVNGILASLKQFVQLDQAQYQTTDIHEGLESAVALLQSHLGEGIAVVRDYGDLPLVHCAPGQLNQVFMHLIKNAAQAHEEAGEIRLRTFVEDGWACIEVIDDGPGIPPEQLEQIFDVGFDKKTERVRMKLGLSMDYNIIRQHHGTMQIESQVGQGTQVTIRLPIRNESSDQSEGRVENRSKL